jgi:drug/metabolite transporter (DMT)-like permease
VGKSGQRREALSENRSTGFIMTDRRLPNLGLLLVTLGAATWGTDTLMRAKLLDPKSGAPFAPVPLVLGEHLVLALYAIPAVIIGWRQIRSLNPGQWAALAYVGWGGSAAATVLFSQGLATSFTLPFPQAASAFNTVFLLQQLQPIFAIIAAAIFLHERLTIWYVPLFLIAAFGAYLVAPFILPVGTSQLTPFNQVQQAPLEFALIGIGAAALWGASTAFGRLLSDKLSFTTLTGARFLMALPFIATWMLVAVPDPIGTFRHGLGQANALTYLILLALVPGLLALLIYYLGLRSTRASYATLAELAFPATGVLVNAFVLDKPPTTLQIIGVALIALAVIIMNWLRTGVIVVPESRTKTNETAIAR